MNRPACMKRTYSSIKQARERTQNLGNRTRCYWCLECSAWHITNQDSNKHHEPEHSLTVLVPAHKGRFKRKPVRAPERAAKLASKQRDRWACRYPDCPVQGRGLVHSAHLRGKGMGGDPLGLVSDKASDYVSLCPQHHRLLDEHFVELAVTPAGGDGPVEFRPRNERTA
jgi:hypothetical protein